MSTSIDGNPAPDTTVTAAATKVDKGSAYRSPIETAELLRADAGTVDATSVTMERSGAESITAERVTMNQSGARTLNARSAQLDNSGAASLHAESVVLHGSSALRVAATQARIVKSRILVLRSEQTTVEGELKPFILIGPACDHVRPVFDGAGALRAGAGFAAVLVVATKVLGRLGRRSS